ncbi:hypothetical protein H2248_008302 [Termitomyces sp. 'cryptogamus']|nr:hypothetical protein H2248_008302 [Termitomyces sp. 'cryptogamus']
MYEIAASIINVNIRLFRNYQNTITSTHSFGLVRSGCINVLINALDSPIALSVHFEHGYEVLYHERAAWICCILLYCTFNKVAEFSLPVVCSSTLSKAIQASTFVRASFLISLLSFFIQHTPSLSL